MNRAVQLEPIGPTPGAPPQEAQRPHRADRELDERETALQGACGSRGRHGSAAVGPGAIRAAAAAAARPALADREVRAPPGQVHCGEWSKAARSGGGFPCRGTSHAADLTRAGAFATPAVFRGDRARSHGIKANAAAVRPLRSHFSRTDRLMIRNEAYTPGSALPALTRGAHRGGGPDGELQYRQAAGAGDIELRVPRWRRRLPESSGMPNTESAPRRADAFKVGR